MTPATILLVEDDRAMLAGIPELLQIGLHNYELEVLTAENGKVGLELMANNTPDLIISDINMPQMNGIEFLDQVRQNNQWLHIPIIFLTAKGKEEDIHLAKTSGVDLYITKPFDSTELIELVRSQLSRAFQLQASRQQTIASLKGDILQILNHELNTPLTYVTAYSELLIDTLEKFDDLSDSYDFLRGIQAGCSRLARLVTDFIKVIELRTGEADSNYERNIQLIEDIVPILQEALRKSEQNNAPNAVKLHFVAPTKRLPVLGHRESLVTAFERLFDNAIKFTYNHKGDTGQVHISLDQPNIYELEVVIEDEGVGFPPHVYHQVFELFYQYNRKEFEQQGMGTGLTIAQELIHLHNGRIQVESTPGTGSIFTVNLPLYQAADTTASPSGDQMGKQALVLVVEDDEHLLNGLQELLDIYEGKYRLHTLAATNGAEGLEVLAQRRPDLIISDIMMPRMGGLEFLERVREIDELVQIPFIFLTAKGERRDILNGIVLGAEEYITKPYDSDILLDLVVAQLDKYFQRQGLLLQSFESLKRNIVQLMSPDFHNPINEVAKHTQQVLGKIEDARTDDELKESLQHIRQGSGQLNQLVKYFIALAELTTDEAKTAFQIQAHIITHMSFSLHGIAELIAYKLQEEGIELTKVIEDGLPSVRGVESTILDCVQNVIKLLKRHYLSPTQDKKIRLSGYQADGEVYIALQGNSALSEAEQEPILALLSQQRQPKVDLSGQDALWRIVQGHIALHNGRIQLSNEPAFTVTLVLPVATSLS